MIARVAHLKEEKETERLKIVEAKREQQFIRNADELRKVDADFNELKVYGEQNIQIMEKQKILQEKYEGKFGLKEGFELVSQFIVFLKSLFD